MSINKAKKLLGRQFNQTVEGMEKDGTSYLGFEFVATVYGQRLKYHELVSIGANPQEAYDNFLAGMEFEPINPEPGEEIPGLVKFIEAGRRFPR